MVKSFGYRMLGGTKGMEENAIKYGMETGKLVLPRPRIIAGASLKQKGHYTKPQEKASVGGPVTALKQRIGRWG